MRAGLPSFCVPSLSGRGDVHINIETDPHVESVSPAVNASSSVMSNARSAHNAPRRIENASRAPASPSDTNRIPASTLPRRARRV